MKIKRLPAPIKIDKKIKVGSVLIFEDLEEVVSLKINQFDFTKSSNKPNLYAVVGLSQSNFVQISGFIKKYSPKHLFKIFSHPEKYFFENFIEVDSPGLRTANKLKLSKPVWQKVSADHDQRKIERRKMQKILKTRKLKNSEQCWSIPLESSVTSRFAAPRTLPNGHSYHHSGVDLRANHGTPIPAAGSGIVVLAEKMIVPGNAVVIHHGQGLFSRYFHLSKIQVKIGQEIRAGDIIGLSGSTGRVEGPHLHWEVVWKGNLADPLHFQKAWELICDQVLAGSSLPIYSPSSYSHDRVMPL